MERVGFSKWSDRIRKQGSAYSIFAAQAPIEKLARELKKRFKVENWLKNVIAILNHL